VLQFGVFERTLKEMIANTVLLNILRLTSPLFGGRGTRGCVGVVGFMKLCCGLEILVKWVLIILKLEKEEVKETEEIKK
jgi:hypothetical protein